MISCRGTNSFHKSLSARLVNSDSGMAAFLRIDPDDHHGTVFMEGIGHRPRSGGSFTEGYPKRTRKRSTKACRCHYDYRLSRIP
jgi:hypothetical protein